VNVNSTPNHLGHVAGEGIGGSQRARRCTYQAGSRANARADQTTERGTDYETPEHGKSLKAIPRGAENSRMKCEERHISGWTSIKAHMTLTTRFAGASRGTMKSKKRTTARRRRLLLAVRQSTVGVNSPVENQLKGGRGRQETQHVGCRWYPSELALLTGGGQGAVVARDPRRCSASPSPDLANRAALAPAVSHCTEVGGE
jgi:hypothetical protein